VNAYVKPISVRWSDLDPNGHVRHSVYYDYGAELRMAFFHEAGLGLAWMARHGVGPILFREEARFFRELHLGDQLQIDARLEGLSDDLRKWSVSHRITRDDELCAVLELDGAWLDLRERRLAAPPAELMQHFAGLPRGDEFRVLS